MKNLRGILEKLNKLTLTQIWTFNTPLTRNLIQQSNQTRHQSNSSCHPSSLAKLPSLWVSVPPSEQTLLICKSPSLNSDDPIHITSVTIAHDSNPSSPNNHHDPRSPKPPNLVAEIKYFCEESNGFI